MHKRWGNNCLNKSFMMSKLHWTNPFCTPITYCILIFRPLYIAETSKIQTNGDIGAITGFNGVCIIVCKRERLIDWVSFFSASIFFINC